jgi:Arc/MetJ family transcription regulator
MGNERDSRRQANPREAPAGKLGNHRRILYPFGSATPALRTVDVSVAPRPFLATTKIEAIEWNDTHKCEILTHRSGPVRTNIEIDDELVSQAMRASGARTKKAVVEAGLRLLVKTHSQTAIRKLRGKVQWEGDLNGSRMGRVRE